MIVLRNNFFVWLFCLFIQKNIPSCSANSNCLNLKLKVTEKLHLQFYFQSEHGNGLDSIICPAVLKFKDVVTFEFKISPLTTGKVGELTCPNDNMCASNRYLACVHKAVNGELNKCVDINKFTFDDIKLADCTCNHETDSVLLQNAQDWAALNLPDSVVPALILNGKYDPCLDLSSVEKFEQYISNIYH